MEKITSGLREGRFVCIDKYLAAALVTRQLGTPEVTWGAELDEPRFIFNTSTSLEQTVMNYLSGKLEVPAIIFANNIKEIEKLGYYPV